MKYPCLPAIMALALFAAAGAYRGSAQVRVPYADCGALANNLSTGLASTDQNVRNLTIDSMSRVEIHAPCFAQSAGFDSLPSFGLIQFLTQGLKNGTQQSSPSGSSSATSAVSKPSGTTTLIQDVGGFSATSNGSSLTFQFAPGDLVNQLGKDGAFAYCTASIRTQGCVSPNLLAIFSRATFSVTANTSTPGAQVSGTAASSGAAVPASLKTSDESLTFGGVTAKYAFFYKQKAATAASPLADPANALAGVVGKSVALLSGCKPYTDLNKEFETKVGSNPDAASIEALLIAEYKTVYAKMAADPTCNAGLVSLRKSLSLVSAYQAAIAAQKAMSASSTPILGVEYDFTTPSNKPSYHSAKLNFNYSIQGKSSCSAQVAVAAAKAMKGQAEAGAVPAHGCSEATPGVTDSTTATPASNASAPSPDWTFSASGSADIYADDPSVTIASANRLRDVQIGAEVTRVWHWSAPTSSAGPWKQFFSSIGDLSLVGAYYYQDQTSPSILNGPPSSVTFNGLPTTASQVFATRGPINVGQVRFGFGTGKNVTFPVAVSYSNRSDLIVHPFLGVQFGVSYGLSGK
jgi:hypothetical protein